ncbi:hypothetical protein AYO38_06315 [bacterium SCGC AG-212-C10]|nr:hypothetical protein AYO38_06315 [bacterium SCGC AG-212-C10]
MAMKIWELHGMRLDGAIRTAPDGEADIDGLLLSEKAYLLAIRDFRPAELVRMVQREGPQASANALIAHYGMDAGHTLVTTRGMSGSPRVIRSDEVKPAAAISAYGRRA